MSMGIDKRLCITVPEAAEILGLLRNHGYKLVGEEQLPVIRFGKSLRILIMALINRLEEGVT